MWKPISEWPTLTELFFGKGKGPAEEPKKKAPANPKPVAKKKAKKPTPAKKKAVAKKEAKKEEPIKNQQLRSQLRKQRKRNKE